MPDRPPGFVQRTSVTVQRGAIAQLARHQAELGIARPLLLMDGNLLGTAVEASVRGELGAAPVVAPPPEEPSSDGVERCAAEISEHEPDGLVAVGGGATLDMGKLVRGLLASGGAPVLGLPDPLPARPLPYIAVPTTAGTGSEAGAGAVVTDPATRRKELVKRVELAPDRAIADSDLTLGLPARLTAWTGLDALAQAVLAYVPAGDASLSGQLAVSAIERVWRWLPRAVEHPDDPQAREQMMLSSVTSAVAMFNAPPTYAAEHLFAEPLGGAFGIPHGHTVAALLVPVAEFNREPLAGAYGALARRLGLAGAGASDEEAALALVHGLGELVRRLEVEPLPRPDGDALEAWVREQAAAGAFGANPRPVSVEDALAIFAAGCGDFTLREQAAR